MIAIDIQNNKIEKLPQNIKTIIGAKMLLSVGKMLAFITFFLIVSVSSNYIWEFFVLKCYLHVLYNYMH